MQSQNLEYLLLNYLYLHINFFHFGAAVTDNTAMSLSECSSLTTLRHTHVAEIATLNVGVMLTLYAQDTQTANGIFIIAGISVTCRLFWL